MTVKNLFQKKINETERSVRVPNMRSMQPSFGQVKKVSDDERQVEILWFRDEKESVNIGWHPVVDDIDDLHNRFGKISPGMCLIIWWKGESTPRQGATWAQIIGKGPTCAGKNLIQAEIKENELALGPYKVFSGGLGF